MSDRGPARGDDATRDGTALGAEVRARREACGVGLRRLSRAVGVSHVAISRLEHGDAGAVGDDTLNAIASELGVSGAARDRWHALRGRLPADLAQLLRDNPGRWGEVREMLSKGRQGESRKMLRAPEVRDPMAVRVNRRDLGYAARLPSPPAHIARLVRGAVWPTEAETRPPHLIYTDRPLRHIPGTELARLSFSWRLRWMTSTLSCKALEEGEDAMSKGDVPRRCPCGAIYLRGEGTRRCPACGLDVNASRCATEAEYRASRRVERHER